MNPSELSEVIDVWYRSMMGSLSYMRPEQLRPEQDYKGFFRTVVATTRDLWVAERQGRIAGVLALEGNDIDRLYVAPEAQGALVGTLLMARAKSLHPQGLTLVTHQRNTSACRFYERHGFQARTFGSSPPPENEPDVVYAWDGSPMGVSST
jgi:GNAT superfamily N-acetyltransferase